MRAYIINLDAHKDRWAFMEQAFAGTSLAVERVPAIDGRQLTLPIPEYSEAQYRWFHGRTPKPGEIGCYLSHVKAMEAFLASGKSHGLICEDDVALGPDFEEVVNLGLSHARHWNILRLTGLGTGSAARVASMGNGYHLCVNLGRLKGTGAYLLDRKAAETLVNKVLPMRLPWDHALDREWWYGLAACSISPYPCSQTDHSFCSSIQGGKAAKLSRRRRWVTTYPYQAANELARWFSRSTQYLRVKATFGLLAGLHLSAEFCDWFDVDLFPDFC